MTTRYTPAMLLCALLSFPVATQAHHSAAAVYDTSAIREIEGTVTRVLWQNPHVRFTIAAKSDRGVEEVWNVETQSVSILGRMQIPSDFLKTGDRVRVAGNPARRGGGGMFVHNILLPDGREVLLRPGASARWSKRTLGNADTWLATAGKTSDPGRGLFGVWSSSLSAPGLFPAGNDRYPLTPAARAAAMRFDPIRDDPLRDCTPKGMPSIMSQPYPIEFVQQGGDIRLRIEEYDTVRMIHMTAQGSAPAPAPTVLGYSVGRWQGRTLVVETSGANWRRFNTVGIPLSGAADMVERFTPSADGSRLDYEIVVTDPETFTKPVALNKYWIWVPEARVNQYKCTNGR